MMNGSYYILSKEKIQIKKLHICTWDTITDNGAVEIGIEFSAPRDASSIHMCLNLPFDCKSVKCMKTALTTDDDNCRFIFNDRITSNEYIGKEKSNGAIVTFENRSKLAILPVDIKTDKGSDIDFEVSNIQHTTTNYVRLLIFSSQKTIAVCKKNITKVSYLYDVKINERRNIPSSIKSLENIEYSICNAIEQCFCFHVMPSETNISYINEQKQKGIRLLESQAFNEYLKDTDLKKLSVNEHIITFCKDSNSADGTYNFFTTFEQEVIGDKQIILALCANILCSLLFAISSLRYVKDPNIDWYLQIPCEYWIALGLLASMSLFGPVSKLIKAVFRWIKAKLK